MKKIFPVITVLILLSLLGLIFFQYQWIDSARQIKEQQLEMNFQTAVTAAGEKLTPDKNALLFNPKKNTDILFPADKLSAEFFNQTGLKRFSRQEIESVLRNAIDKYAGKELPFEFGI